MEKKFDSNEQYHSHDSISASGLKYIAEYPIEKFLSKENVTTPAMALGSATHEAIYQPQVFYKNYYPMPKLDLRYKKNKILKAEHEDKASGKTVIDEVDFNRIIEMMKKTNEHKLAKKYLNGIIEQSHYFKWGGVDCRCRPDCLEPVDKWISDLKTIREIKHSSIPNEIYNRNYDLQAYAYCLWLDIPLENFRFIFVETAAPYQVEVIALSEKQMEYGQRKFEEAFDKWSEYKKTGKTTGVRAKGFAPDGAKIL